MQAEDIPIPDHVRAEAEALTSTGREALCDEFFRLSSLETATLQRRLKMLRVIDAANLWAGWPNCAEWLSFKIGLSPVTARTHLRISRQLAYLPVVDAAFARGELSYSKVRVLCSVLKPEALDPKYEQKLVEWGRIYTATQLQQVVGCARNCLEGGAEAAAERERRTSLRVEQLGGGMTLLKVCLPSDVAARVLSSAEAGMEDLVRGLLHPSPDESAASAAETSVAETSVMEASAEAEQPVAGEPVAGEPVAGEPVAGEPVAGESVAGESVAGEPFAGESGGDAEGVVRGSAIDPYGTNGPRRVGDPAGSLQNSGLRPSVSLIDGFVSVFEHYLEHRTCSQPGKPGEVLLTVCSESLTGTVANRCQVGLAGVHQWTCDAVVQPVLTDPAGNVLDVGRRHRTVPQRMRRALGLRDGEQCQFPGCGARALLDAHHLEHWLGGGETKLSNLCLICRRHHRFLHQAKFSVELTSTGLVFRDPWGRVLEPAKLPYVTHPSRELGAFLRESPTPKGLHCLDGTPRYDRHMAVDGIIQAVRRAHVRGSASPRTDARP